jgi:hypothetical protein
MKRERNEDRRPKKVMTKNKTKGFAERKEKECERNEHETR